MKKQTKKSKYFIVFEHIPKKKNLFSFSKVVQLVLLLKSFFFLAKREFLVNPNPNRKQIKRKMKLQSDDIQFSIAEINTSYKTQPHSDVTSHISVLKNASLDP